MAMIGAGTVGVIVTVPTDLAGRVFLIVVSVAVLLWVLASLRGPKTGIAARSRTPGWEWSRTRRRE
jgi:hypothetical protein